MLVCTLHTPYVQLSGGVIYGLVLGNYLCQQQLERSVKCCKNKIFFWHIGVLRTIFVPQSSVEAVAEIVVVAP